MVDREDFEDKVAIERYLDAIPEPNTAYRAALRTRLATPSQTRARRLPRLRLRWTAPATVGLAVAAALALLLAPFGPRQEAPLSPKTVLARAVAAASGTVPYTGSSQMSFVASEDGAPPATANDLGRHEVVSRWTVRDMSHWRVDFSNVQPGLHSEHDVAVANGSSVVWYRDITNRAQRFPLASPQMGGVLLSVFQNGQGLPLAQTLAQYLQELNNPKTHTHARLVGQDTVLGRKADVLEVWPVVRTSSTGPCKKPGQCAQRTKEVGYGRARMWIDHQHGLLLRYQDSGLPANVPGAPRDWVYRVTSLSYGNGPTDGELSYQSPVPPVSTSGLGELHSSSSSRSMGGNARWHAPAGFISTGTPSDSQGTLYPLTSTGQSEDSLGHTTSVYALYSTVAGPPGPTPTVTGPFVYVQEQYRATGLPEQLKTGTQTTAGRCTVYTGTYSDGLHWIALAQGKISLLAVSDRLAERELRSWAATQICQ